MNVREWLGETNTLGIDIWNKKYRHNNETFDEWLDRVSGGDTNIKQLIIDKKFLFAGRILAGRGCIDKEQCKMTLSNCYVLPPVDDNIESIFDTAGKLARTFSYGGGVGVDISRLAPINAKVRNSAKTSTGSVSFMDLYSLTTGLIGQNNRMGALIITMDVSHPDIEEFIKVKSDMDKVTKANISIRITNEFMEAVENDGDFELSFVRSETGEEISRTVKAKALFALICQQAWDNAEPGVLFWDRIQEYNLMQYDSNYQIAGVNPCGEQCLPAGGACLLGSINLAAFVNPDRTFDFGEFIHVVHIAVNALNKVLDEGIAHHPLKIQRETASNWRPMGLGVMGLADMLIKMEITYGSLESFDICDRIGKVMAQEAILQSIEDARVYGEFPNCDRHAIIKSDFFKKHSFAVNNVNVLNNGIRNCQLICDAPTGTISTMLGISGGIEPIFDKFYTRKTESIGKNTYNIYTQIVWDYMQEHGINEGEEDKLPEWFVTAKEIGYRDRVKMQAVWQEHTDVSISSTVNLPESTTIEDVMDLYMTAWKEGLKGVTIFREGCRRAPILDSSKKKEEKKDKFDIKNVELKGQTVSKFYDDIMEKMAKDVVQKESACIRFKEYSDKILHGGEKVNVKDMLKSWNDTYPDTETVGSSIRNIYDAWIAYLNREAQIHGRNSILVESKESRTLERGEVIKAPANSIGKKRDLMTGCGSLHFQAFFDQERGNVVETYLSKGSKGGCNSFMIGLSRMISLAGRAGVDIHTIADQLQSAPACTSYAARRASKHDTSKGICCPGAVGYALIEMYEEVREEIEFGGVYKGSPLYYKMKAEREKEESAREIIPKVDRKEHDNINTLIPSQTSKLADALLSIPGMNEVFSNISDEDVKKALNSIYGASYNSLGRNMDVSLASKFNCDNRADEEPEIGPVPKEVRDVLVKDLTERTDSKIYDWINEGNNREKSARLFSALKDHPHFNAQLAESIRKGGITSLEELMKKIDHGLKPVGMGSTSPLFADIQDDLKDHYVDTVGLCPECGAPLTFEGGCNTCKECGWSKCD